MRLEGEDGVRHQIGEGDGKAEKISLSAGLRHGCGGVPFTGTEVRQAKGGSEVEMRNEGLK